MHKMILLHVISWLDECCAYYTTAAKWLKCSRYDLKRQTSNRLQQLDQNKTKKEEGLVGHNKKLRGTEVFAHFKSISSIYP